MLLWPHWIHLSVKLHKTTTLAESQEGYGGREGSALCSHTMYINYSSDQCKWLHVLELGLVWSLMPSVCANSPYHLFISYLACAPNCVSRSSNHLIAQIAVSLFPFLDVEIPYQTDCTVCLYEIIV